MENMKQNHIVGSINQKEIIPTRIFFQCVVLFILIFLAFSGWIGGGDPSTIEIGVRSYIEIGLVISTLFLIFFMWGPSVFLRGFRSPSFLILCLFCGWSLLSALWSPSVFLSAGKSLELFITIIIAAAVANQVKTSNLSLNKIIQLSIILVVVILFIVNLFYYHQLFPLLIKGGRTRFTLGFNNPNLTAIYFQLIIFCSIFIIFDENHPTKSLFQIAISTISFVFLFLTNSRTTLIATIFGVITLFILKIKSFHLKILILLSGLLVTLLLALAYFSGALNQLLENLDLQSILYTIFGRIDIWHFAIQSAKEMLLIGEGYFTSRLLLLNNYAWASHAHNSFIEVLVTTGLIGTFIISIFYISTLSLFTSLRKHLFPLVYLLIMTIQSITEVRLFIPSISMFTVCILVFFHQQQTTNISRYNSKKGMVRKKLNNE